MNEHSLGRISLNVPDRESVGKDRKIDTDRERERDRDRDRERDRGIEREIQR